MTCCIEINMIMGSVYKWFSLERGTKYGVLTKDLPQYQENVFVEQIKEIIPSDFYFSFLHKLYSYIQLGYGQLYT